ncbi:MAG: hypothetical protein NW208_15430 [Bryobacter sp.]|nr:hypothetical protein [Bryobacter sp.]
MPQSRRTFVKLWGAAATAAPLFPSPVEGWDSLDQLPRSQSFGLSDSGAAKDPISLYSRNTPGGAPLSFDISNHQILCSLSVDGVNRPGFPGG